MQWLSSISVRRPVFATVIILTLLVFGLVGYTSLGVDKFPKVEFPFVLVTTVYPGASPSAVEMDVTDPIEAAVNTVSGIEQLNSTSSEGASLVMVQFALDKDPDTAAQEVRDRLATITNNLPRTIRAPIIQRLSGDSTPVAVIAVRSIASVRELTDVADRIVKRRIERVAGVGQVLILGGQKRRINVFLDPIRLQAAQISALEVQRAIATANVDQPGGRVDQGPTEASLRIEGRAVDPQGIGDIVVRQVVDHAIKVRDVATIEDGAEVPESAAGRDGVAAVALSVQKQSGTNTVEVVDAVKAALAEVASQVPAGYTVDLVRDNSETIRTSASLVVEHLILGAGLAAIVVLIFLGNFRSTIIAAVSIPVSILTTFGLMWVAGFTLNMMTLLALALAVGIVIDDAIVVLENIYRFIDEKGMKPFPAAIAATKEISLAVLATTLSLMAVFLPVAFMSGIVGKFLLSFGLTMAFAVGVSMIVSFILTPMMAARMLSPPSKDRRRSILERAVNAFYRPIERFYLGVLRVCLRHRWIIVIALFVVFPLGFMAMKKAGGGFLPENDDAQFEISLRAPEGSSLETTTLIGERIARQVRTLPEVDHTLVTVADTGQHQANVGRIYIRLSDPVARTKSQVQVMEDVRHLVLARVPKGIQASAQLVNDFGGGQKNAMLMYNLRGPDLQRVEMYAHKALEALKDIPGVVDAESTMVDAKLEPSITLNKDRAAMLGVEPGDITSTLGILVGGIVVSSYEEKGEQYDVFLRASEKYRADVNGLSLMTIPSRTLGLVPLSDVVGFSSVNGPSEIHRDQRTKSVTLFANVAPGGDQQAIGAALVKAVTDLHMPAGYNLGAIGQAKEMGKMMKAFAFAFLLSFIFMYLILAAQFESWVHPFVILLALPLTFPFAMISVYLFGQQLNLFSMLGLLVLFGVVKKNAILQIDHTNQLRATGMNRFDAVMLANKDRLRPILMTTLAFVAGMIPLVFSKGIGSGFSRAMGGIVIGGQTLSLALTLVAIPVLYTFFDDLSKWSGQFVYWVRRKPPLVDRGQAEVEAAHEAAHGTSSGHGPGHGGLAGAHAAVHASEP